MKTIWKFHIEITDLATVRMPAGAKVIHAHADTSGISLWAVVDSSAKTVQRQFAIRGTGHPLGVVGPHVASILDGPFVWHVFEAS